MIIKKVTKSIIPATLLLSFSLILPLVMLFLFHQVNAMGLPSTPPTPPSTPPTPPTSPQVNYAPVIATQRLSPGKVGRTYKEQIRAKDKNMLDNLKMEVFGLPPGIVLGNCVQRRELRNTLTCNISGKPTVSGVYEVRVVVDDGQIQTEKNISLTISPR